MNPSHQALLEYFEKAAHLTEDERAALVKVVKEADRALTIAEFKLDRTEKVKRTTAILLEETIEELEQKRAAIEQTNAALSKSLEELKAAQAQLIHAEKMASLGELTAGIAHEIQNPLNFVNNFSEVSIELIGELKNELNHVKTQYLASHLASQHLASQQIDLSHLDEAEGLLNDIESNQQKINHHGKRAAGIVKGMLMHSRTNKGKKEAADINALVDEYLRLAYHGSRAKDKSFNVKLETHYDDAIEKLEVVPQDIGRVILNLITNAFHAVNEKKKTHTSGYEPTVWVRTRQAGDLILISVEDNGNGIPEEIVGKIFQPFFTTKPTGQGTGLGLSLAYDIVTKGHGGMLEVETREGEGLPAGQAGTEFKIILPC